MNSVLPNKPFIMDNILEGRSRKFVRFLQLLCFEGSVIFNMDMATFIDYYRKGDPIPCDDAEFNELLAQCTSEAQEITMELNNKYHSQEEITALFSKLTGRTMDPGFACNPPFYSNFGKNITIGKNVFFNMGCTFQDRGGIYIGDGTLLGMNVTIATLNHGLDPDERNTTIASPVHVGENVWVGASATILPGVTIGKNAVVGAGAVVTKDVAENTVVAGVPAKAVKQVK